MKAHRNSPIPFLDLYFVALAVCFLLKLNNSNISPLSFVTLDNHKVFIELADTPAKQAQGLSGIEELKDGYGMLFPFNPTQMVSFWMKDMLIPIDMIFIKDNRVVTLYTNVEPEPEVALSMLKRYSPNQVIDYVLEVPAGWSDKNKIIVGSTAIYTPSYDPAQN